MASVLFVESDHPTVAALQDVLEVFGHTATGVSTADQALSAVDRRSYELVLVNLHLESVDGFGLIHALKAQNSRLRILGLTHAPRGANAKRALEAGALRALRKPFEIGPILKLLDEVLE